MCTARELQCQLNTKTRTAFVPLLDMAPSEPDAMHTSIAEAIRISKAADQECNMLVNDQQL